MKKFMKNGPKSLVLSIAAIACCAIIMLGISRCKQEKSAELTTVAGQSKLKINSAQPLPGGRKYFSTVSGNMNATGDTWVQVLNMTFDDATGTVAGSRWWWGSTNKKDAVSLGLAHNCTQDGVLGSCQAEGPAGWLSGTSNKQSVAGNYTFNATTNELIITWTDAALAPRAEKWVLSNPYSTLSRIDWVAPVGTGWGTNPQTHGVGFGSNEDFTIHKVVGSVPAVDYTQGQRVTVTCASSSSSPVTTGWVTDAFNMTGWTTAVGGQTWHADLASSPSVCNSGCAAGNSHTGIIYHLAGEGATGTSRRMALTHFCACLPQPADFPCYSGNLHPYAFMQIIDDGGTMKGFVGIEAQNPTGAAYNGAYQFQLKWYLK